MTRSNQPDLVSVVMPAYNAERTIASSLRSVLNQTYRLLDVVVVDDGSTDGTSAIARAICDQRVRLVHQSNRGVAAARNAGILEARGDLVAFIDADDLWHPTKIEKQLNLLRCLGETVAVIYTWSWFIDSMDRLEGRYFAPEEAGDVYASLVLHNIVGNGSTPLVRKRCLVEFGGFDSGLRHVGAQGCEDLKLWLQIAQDYDFGVVEEFLVGYRQDATSMSKRLKEMRRSYEFVVTDVRQKRPEVPERVFRWSRAKYLFYLAENCAMAGRRFRGILLWLEVVMRDPSVLLILRFRRARARLRSALGLRAKRGNEVYRRLLGQKFLPPPTELQGYRPPELPELERQRRAAAASIRVRSRPLGCSTGAMQKSERRS